jgi:hypothetical protein
VCIHTLLSLHSNHQFMHVLHTPRNTDKRAKSSRVHQVYPQIQHKYTKCPQHTCILPAVNCPKAKSEYETRNISEMDTSSSHHDNDCQRSDGGGEGHCRALEILEERRAYLHTTECPRRFGAGILGVLIRLGFLIRSDGTGR